MIKKVFFVFLIFFFLLTLPTLVQASGNSYVSIINPIRGQDFWDLKNQNTEEVVIGQAEIIKKNNVAVTWLVRFDALSNPQIINILKAPYLKQEVGLLLEITPTWTNSANIKYRESKSWHFAGSVFLSGYNRQEREKLIDTAFENFKTTFGYFPKTVGSWWIDAYSMQYMYDKYKIESALIVSDQYTTDNYQIWGQYFSTPFYPSKTSVLTPAQSVENKIPVVVIQWAPRDPVNGYGKSVEDSTLSVQPNDYIDYHKLGVDYFSTLVDIYTKQKLNSFGHLVVGLENSYEWQKYKDEYIKQINILSKKQSEGQLNLVTAAEFARWYKQSFPKISPEQIIQADDPLGSNKKVVWFMNPYYRVGWFFDNNGSAIRDIRQYIEGTEEMCYQSSCETLNFATFPTRVLDDVTYGKKWVLDKGDIHNFNVTKQQDIYKISYKNDAGLTRNIEFHPRDLAVDGNIKTIDTTILNALSQQNDSANRSMADAEKVNIIDQLAVFVFDTSKFILYISILALLGLLVVSRVKQDSDLESLFLSTSLGMALVAIVSYIFAILNIRLLIPIIILIFIFLNLKKYLNLIKTYIQKSKDIKNYKIEAVIITIGIIFQGLTMFKSGWVYEFGVGFWGPTGRDGVWHQALSNALIKSVPPQNPIFSGERLTNYHYFYDLLVAQTSILSKISVEDLIYRFFPLIFSLLLGIGTVVLIQKISDRKISRILALYLVYFSGSFGWVVEYLRERHLGGESAFWVNQSVSMNLNPPFAVSLILMIATILSLGLNTRSKIFKSLMIILFAGLLVEFKAYGGVIILISLFFLALQRLIFEKSFYELIVFILTFLVSIVLFVPQNTSASSLIAFSPFWFIHSMIDFPDRVGWFKLSAARDAYYARGEWFKFLLAESISFWIFLLGNLGVRSIALFGALKLMSKKFYIKIENVMLLFISLSSFFIPLFFIQKGSPWNTIQFMYYLLYTSAIFAAEVLTFIYLKQKKIFRVVLLVVTLIITPINAFVTFRSGFYPFPPARLSHKELQGLNFLKKEPEGVVLVPIFENGLKQSFKDPYPLAVYDSTSYVSAFSAKPVYIEDEIQQDVLQTDYKKRIVSTKEFFSSRDYSWSKGFLRDNNIKYIYIPKIYNKGLDENKIGLKNIFENDEVIIYGRIN